MWISGSIVCSQKDSSANVWVCYVTWTLQWKTVTKSSHNRYTYISAACVSALESNSKFI